jgi:HAD superfamily hydrolase (TIGR01509 family)
MDNCRAVLWDMDGTLIDSEEYHWIAWREALRAAGVTITYDQFLATFGERNDLILTQWLGTPSPERIERISNAKEEIYRQLVRERGIEPLPGVARWVRLLDQQGWLQAIATAAPRKNVEVVLEVLCSAHRFQAVVSAEDVHSGKPDPEVYVLASERLGVPPERCIVVEDAAAGIEGARAAGMKSIGVTHCRTHLPADLVVPWLDRLDRKAFETLLDRGSLLFAAGL